MNSQPATLPALCAGLSSLDALGADDTSGGAPARVGEGSFDVLSQVPQVLGALLLIVGVIVVFAWLARRMMSMPQRGTGPLRVITGLPLGTRERVILLEACGQRLLVGVTPGRIETLHVFGADANTTGDLGESDEVTDSTESAESTEYAGASGQFARLMASMSGRRDGRGQGGQ